MMAGGRQGRKGADGEGRLRPAFRGDRLEFTGGATAGVNANLGF